MQRSFSTPAIILNLKPQGENNSTVTIITPEKGILYVTLYGGPKSKMKSIVSQWNSGIIYLYENPEKNQIKISDFEVKSYHNSFSQNLFKLYAASLAAELLIKTSCGGSNQQSWNLISGLLDGMELSTEEQSRLGLIRFLWRYLEILGIQPDTSCCGFCDNSFLSPKFAPDNICYYNIVENNCICDECISSHNQTFALKIQGARYLTGISVLTPAEVRKLQIDKESFYQIRDLIFFLIENNIGTKLNTIETGMGIL